MHKFAFLLFPTTLAAQDISLTFPVACTLDADCYIQNLVDHDPGTAASDFLCNALTYDGHKGTDIALLTTNAQADVLAAAPGTVARLRDGMADILQTAPNAPDITGQDCGNGVVITHAGGWESQYCHLASGSLRVAVGQTVAAGDILGEIGLSGRTEFPHLHFSLRHNRTVIDPYDPDGTITCGAPETDTLWAEPHDLPRGGIITAGFADAVPAFDDIKSGAIAAQTPNADTPLVFWSYVYGGRAGDTLSLRIAHQDGVVFETTQDLDRTQARLFRAGGKRAPTGGWPTGTYLGTTQLYRDGALVDSHTAQVIFQTP